MLNMSNRFYFIMILSLIWMTIPRMCLAAQDIDLSISPPVSYLQVKPGTNYTHRVNLQQNGSLPLKINYRLVDFRPDGQTGRPVLQDKSSFHYLKIIAPTTQADLEPNSFILNAGQNLSVILDLNIPSQALEKEYPLSLLFTAQALNPASDQGSRPIVSAAIASNVIILVKDGPTSGQIKISDIKTPLWIDSFSQNLPITVIGENPTLFAASASGQVKIANMRGQTIAKFEIYPDIILGNSQRALRRKLPDDQVSELNYRRRWWLGLYTITAGDQTARVIALPFVLIIILLCGGLLAGFNLLFKRKFTLVEKN